MSTCVVVAAGHQAPIHLSMHPIPSTREFQTHPACSPYILQCDPLNYPTRAGNNCQSRAEEDCGVKTGETHMAIPFQYKTAAPATPSTTEYESPIGLLIADADARR